MKGFKAFYIWGMNAKFYMGIYFAAIVFFVGIITALYGGDSLRLSVLLQMFLVSLAVGFSQAGLLPASADFSRGILFGRSAIWLLLSVGLIVAVSRWGGWFSGLPGWCSWLLGAGMLAGFVCMLLGLRMEQEADTLRLNAALRSYQERDSGC